MDWVLVSALLISILIGVIRGFTREVLGLASWLVALAAALILAPAVAPMLEGKISVPSLRIAASYAIVFVVGLVIGGIVTAIVSSLVRKSPLSGVDRMVGGGFGAVRGVLIAVMMVWLVGMTPARQDPWWGQSLFVGRLEWLAQAFDKAMPADWANRLKSTAVVKEGV